MNSASSTLVNQNSIPPIAKLSLSVSRRLDWASIYLVRDLLILLGQCMVIARHLCEPVPLSEHQFQIKRSSVLGVSPSWASQGRKPRGLGSLVALCWASGGLLKSGTCKPYLSCPLKMAAFILMQLGLMETAISSAPSALCQRLLDQKCCQDSFPFIS